MKSRRRGEEIPTCYAIYRDSSQGNNMWSRSPLGTRGLWLQCFIFHFLSKSVKVDLAERAFLRNERDEGSCIATGSCDVSCLSLCVHSFVFCCRHKRMYEAVVFFCFVVFFPDECPPRCLVLEWDNPLEQGRGGLHGCWAQRYSQGSSQKSGRDGWRWEKKISTLHGHPLFSHRVTSVLAASSTNNKSLPSKEMLWLLRTHLNKPPCFPAKNDKWLTGTPFWKLGKLNNFFFVLFYMFRLWLLPLNYSKIMTLPWFF